MKQKIAFYSTYPHPWSRGVGLKAKDTQVSAPSRSVRLLGEDYFFTYHQISCKNCHQLIASDAILM